MIWVLLTSDTHFGSNDSIFTEFIFINNLKQKLMWQPNLNCNQIQTQSMGYSLKLTKKLHCCTQHQNFENIPTQTNGVQLFFLGTQIDLEYNFNLNYISITAWRITMTAVDLLVNAFILFICYFIRYKIYTSRVQLHLLPLNQIFTLFINIFVVQYLIKLGI